MNSSKVKKYLAIEAGKFEETKVDRGFLSKLKELKDKTEILEKQQEM